MSESIQNVLQQVALDPWSPFGTLLPWAEVEEPFDTIHDSRVVLTKTSFLTFLSKNNNETIWNQKTLVVLWSLSWKIMLLLFLHKVQTYILLDHLFKYLGVLANKNGWKVVGSKPAPVDSFKWESPCSLAFVRCQRTSYYNCTVYNKDLAVKPVVEKGLTIHGGWWQYTLTCRS